MFIGKSTCSIVSCSLLGNLCVRTYISSTSKYAIRMCTCVQPSSLPQINTVQYVGHTCVLNVHSDICMHDAIISFYCLGPAVTRGQASPPG